MDSEQIPKCCGQVMKIEHGDNGNGGYEYGWLCESCGKSLPIFYENREGN